MTPIAFRVFALPCAFRPWPTDEAGETWVAADIELGEELEATGKATRTRGQLRGDPRFVSGAIVAPPTSPPTLAELGLPGDAGKKRAARAVKLASGAV